MAGKYIYFQGHYGIGEVEKNDTIESKMAASRNAWHIVVRRVDIYGCHAPNRMEIFLTEVINMGRKKLKDLSDAELLLYQSVMIARMREEILNVFSQFDKMPQATAEKILDNHYYDIDDWKLMREVLTRHYPEMIKDGSIKDMQDKAFAVIKGWEESK